VIQREPSVFNNILTTASESSGGLSLVKQIPHNQLVVLNDRDVWVPQLAAEQIAVERGTWRINPDGTMDTVWKLRPNVKWHDGVPFTSDDLLFSFTVYKDPDLPNRAGAVFRLMDSATAPDPLTFIVHWSAAYALADTEPPFDPLPRHRLEALYLTDKASLTDTPLLREEFVGLGAYRLAGWVRGSHLEFAPFDDYYLGRPPLRHVIVQVIPNLNTVIANVLAGTLDVVMLDGVTVENGLELRDRWQGTGHQVQFVPKKSPGWIEIQHRPEFARPANGLTNRTVRQALLHGIDREAVNQLLNAGLGSVADSWVGPNEEIRGQLAPAIPQYPYDPARAQQLLAEAGWVRGPSGVLTNRTSGDVFNVEARADIDTASEQLMAVVANDWTALGAQVALTSLTPAMKNSNEARATFSGVHGQLHPPLLFNIVSHLHSKSAASAATRWSGGRTGYSNPRADAVMERFVVTIERGTRLALHRELLQEVIGDVALMPVTNEVEPVVFLKGVTGIKGSGAWNFHEWAKQ
jgi:peptide/nickel transport system substrate-binding protein